MVTNSHRRIDRAAIALACIALIASLQLPTAGAVRRQSTKDQDTARLIELQASIDSMTTRVRAEPNNARLQTKLDAAIAEYDAISARLGGDRAQVTETQSASSPAGGGPPPAPPGCTETTFAFSNNTPVAIVDNTVVTSTINVAGAGPSLWDLNVQTFITHTFAADLDVTITSPVGTVVTLTTDNGSSNDNVFNGTFWDDDADPDTQVPYSSNPNLVAEHTYSDLTVVPTLVPEEALGAFNGENPNGTWTLRVSDDATGDIGSFTWSLNLTTLASAPTNAMATASNNTPVAIVDNTVVMSTINVAGAGTSISDTNVQTFITHTFCADLDITLTSPAGTVVTLTTDNGSSNDNVFNGTTWDDDADPGTQVPYTSNPFIAYEHTYSNNVVATPLLPEESLEAFAGEDPNGTWTLRISDDATGDVGSLNSWTLNFLTASCAAACTITCPPPQNVTATDLNGAVVNYPAPTTTGTCGPVTCSPPSGSQFPVGTTTVTCTESAGTTTVTTVYSSGNIAVPIPDNNPTGASVTINVPDTGMVTDVNVRLRLNHTFDSDLAIGLNHASSGNALSNNRGGSGDNYGTGNNDCSGTKTVFDDQAGTPIGSGAAPFAGSFMPESGLSIHNGSDASGAWTLRAIDSANLDTGTIGCVELEITRVASTPGASCSFPVTVTIPFDGCCIDDYSHDTFMTVVANAPPGSSLYGYWEYHVAATGETFSGVANYVAYRPGLSLVMRDNDDAHVAMYAQIDYIRKTCLVQVTDRTTGRIFTLRDRNITNSTCGPQQMRAGL